MFVKICGITRIADATASIDAGADWLGLNFVGGPRMIDPCAGLDILASVGAADRVVALIRIDDHRPPPAWLEAMRIRGLRLLQLYGDPTTDQLARLVDRGFQLIRVGHVAPHHATITDPRPRANGDEVLLSATCALASYVLLDTAVPATLGGSGVKLDWTKAATMCRALALRFDASMLLAGGLTPENVGDAIRIVRPFGVDVSSGVESKPGVKDIRQVAAFVQAARTVGQEAQ